MKIVKVSQKPKWLKKITNFLSFNKNSFLDENEAISFVYDKFHEEYLNTLADLECNDLSIVSKKYINEQDLKMYECCYTTKRITVKEKIKEKLNKLEHILSMLNKLIEEEIKSQEDLDKVNEFIELCFKDRMRGGLDIEYVCLGDNKFLNFGEILLRKLNKLSTYIAPVFLIYFNYRN